MFKKKPKYQFYYRLLLYKIHEDDNVYDIKWWLYDRNNLLVADTTVYVYEKDITKEYLNSIKQQAIDKHENTSSINLNVGVIHKL